MKITNTILNKRLYLYALGLLVSGGVLIGSGVYSRPASAQAANSVYVATASGSYAVGSTFTISIRENSGTAVNAAQADLGYSTSALEFVSIDGSGTAFGIDASSTGGNGSVSVSRGTTTPVSGDQLIAKVTFRVLAITTATVQMQSSSVVLSSSTNTNVVNARNGGTYTLTTPAGTSPAPTPTPSPTPTAPTTSPSSERGATTPTSPVPKPATTSTVTIASQGNSQTTALPGDSVVELSTPATVEATPVNTKPVAKVEYLVNGKNVATIIKAPYSYSVDTTKYRNGTYTLTTKTYYKDGTTDSSSASLVVKNPFGVSQALLQIRHYLWMVILAILIVAGLVIWLKRRKGGRGPKTDVYGNDTSVDYGPPRNTPPPAPQTTAFIAPAQSAPTVTVEPTPPASASEPGPIPVTPRPTPISGPTPMPPEQRQ